MPVFAVVLAAVPIALLAVLVVRSHPLASTAWLCGGVAAVLAMTVFALSAGEVGVAALRGLWTGAWILMIVLPALLLYEVLDGAGALDRLADELVAAIAEQPFCLGVDQEDPPPLIHHHDRVR